MNETEPKDPGKSEIEDSPVSGRLQDPGKVVSTDKRPGSLKERPEPSESVMAVKTILAEKLAIEDRSGGESEKSDTTADAVARSEEGAKICGRQILYYLSFVILASVAIWTTPDAVLFDGGAISLPLIKADLPLNLFLAAVLVGSAGLLVMYLLHLAMLRDNVAIAKKSPPHSWVYGLKPDPRDQSDLVDGLQRHMPMLAVWMLFPILWFVVSARLLRFTFTEPFWFHMVLMLPLAGCILGAALCCSIGWNREKCRFGLLSIGILAALSMGFLGWGHRWHRNVPLVNEVVGNDEPAMNAETPTPGGWKLDPDQSLKFTEKTFWKVFIQMRLSNGDLSGIERPYAPLARVKAKQTDFSNSELVHANFRGAVMSGVIFDHAKITVPDFRQAILTGAKFGHADITSPDFTEAVATDADFSNATLSDGTKFNSADLTGASFEKAIAFGVDFSDATSIERANFDGADLSGAIFWREDSISRANLKQSTFAHARAPGSFFNKSNLENANFTGADLKQARLAGAILFGANFENANLTSATIGNLNKETSFKNADLEGADFSGASRLTADHLEEAKILRGAIFKDADLPDANLSDADLSDADLSDADLSKANLSDANLSKANLSDAILADAVFDNATLSDANFTGANLDGVDFANAIGLTVDQLEKAKSADGTKFPNSWSKEDREKVQSEFAARKTKAAAKPAEKPDTPKDGETAN